MFLSIVTIAGRPKVGKSSKHISVLMVQMIALENFFKFDEGPVLS